MLSKNEKRNNMPQIEDIPSFRNSLLTSGIQSHMLKMPASQLKASQGELSSSKVHKFIKMGIDELQKKPLVVSSDLHILDGHHRWAALKELNAHASICKIDLPIAKLHSLAHNFNEGISHDDIWYAYNVDELDDEEETTFGITDLYFLNRKNQPTLMEESIAREPFFRELERKGEVYFVGGAVRDEFLNIQSKDIDLVVRGLSIDQIASILQRYGKVVSHSVGGKQAVIKFTPRGEKEEIDIAIPRTEIKKSAGHKGFSIEPDPNLSLIKDLERRDFTINAIAKDRFGKVFDPFGGQEDLKKKVIRAVSDKSFPEDPLRMLRAVQFASRLGFTIAPDTLTMIKQTAPKIREISPERILIEFQKIVQKGDPKIAAKLLQETKLYENIFGQKFKGDMSLFNKVSNLGEFVFALLQGFEEPADVFKSKLKGDNETAKYIHGLSIANDADKDKLSARMAVFRINQISSSSLSSNLIPQHIKRAASESYPKSYKQLAVSGKDLMEYGFRGKSVGEMLSRILKLIFQDKLENSRKEILHWLEQQR